MLIVHPRHSKSTGPRPNDSSFYYSKSLACSRLRTLWISSVATEIDRNLVSYMFIPDSHIETEPDFLLKVMMTGLRYCEPGVAGLVNNVS